METDTLVPLVQQPLAGAGAPTPAPYAGAPVPVSFNSAIGQAYMVAEDPLEWTTQMRQAVLAFAGVTVAPGDATLSRVARTINATPEQLRRWRAHPEFQAEVNKVSAQATEKIYESGLALKSRRVMELQKRHALLTEVMERREEWAAVNAEDNIVTDTIAGEAIMIPGLDTGTIVLRRKSVGSGENQHIFLEAEIDLPLLRELRAIEEHIARELGQWRPEAQVSVDVKLYAGIDISQV